MIIVALINWALIGLMIWKLDPATVKDFFFANSYLPMMAMVALGIFWMLSILFMNSGRAGRWTLGVVAYLYMRIWGLGSWLNAALVIGILLSLEFYLMKTESNIKKKT